MIIARWKEAAPKRKRLFQFEREQQKKGESEGVDQLHGKGLVG